MNQTEKTYTAVTMERSGMSVPVDTVVRGTPRRPAVRYHGGKWKLADWIISQFPDHRVYTEVFGGGASVLLRKPRSYAEIYNDLDGEIVNLFRVLRDDGLELLRLVELTPFSRGEFVLSYKPTDNAVEQARRTVVRSFMGFGSNAHNRLTGFRSNSNRSGTTPAHDWRNYPDAMPALIDRLRGVVIENRDAAAVLAAHDGIETLHYVDPPYVHQTRSQKARGTGTEKSYRHELDDGQHRELAELLHGLKGAVVLSGYRCELYDELYSDWTRIDRVALADGARERTESLWISREARQGDLLYL